MFPKQNNYPEFVADQLLTADQLNELFGYLEEQERLTRTNLIGIGIVCGLEVQTSADGSSITITKGCGVTSDGYVISVPTTTYTEYSTYNPVQDKLYEKFVDLSTRTPLISPIYELEEAGVTTNTTNLSQSFLSDKVVLLYVELLENNIKNCNPNSCDDKGMDVTISFKPLLISKSDVATLGAPTTGNNSTTSAYQSLPTLKMPRYNVTATPLLSSTQVFKSYLKILNATFIKSIEQDLSQTYSVLSPLIGDLYSSDPFTGFSDNFSFLSDGTITETELINIQYYYDLFSDLMLAYEELRKTGMELICMCCPDNTLFRLHLLLDLAIPDTTVSQSQYRQYFIPSPAVDCCCRQTNELRWIFKRIVLLMQRFFVSPMASGYFRYGMVDFNNNVFRRRVRIPVRITPSKLGDVPLGDKAIPFYYDVTEGTDQLYKFWNEKMTDEGDANQILSYNSDQYNTTDDFVLNPLKYDLEPYNFLRIEGHIGMTYQDALKNITTIKNNYRLPFQVIALSADLTSLKTTLSSLGRSTATSELFSRYQDQLKSRCEFQDLEAIYDTLVAELICLLCNEMKYYYTMPSPNGQAMGQVQAPSILPLFKRCDSSFQVAQGTLGYDFEQYYTNLSSATNTEKSMLYAYDTGASFNNDSYSFFTLMYAMERLFEAMPSSLSGFTIARFEVAGNEVRLIAARLEARFKNLDSNLSNETTIEHLDRLIAGCMLRQFETLYKDYLTRLIYVMMLQKFGYFVRLHPGIQHKGGVPMGGTFIIVYHETQKAITSTDNTNINRAIGAQSEAVNVTERATPSSSVKMDIGTQPLEKMNTVGTQAQDVYQVKPNYLQLNDILKGSKVATKEEVDALKAILDTNIIDDNSLSTSISDIANDTVIADFYLPYLCCSDCPPIYYVINETTAENVTIDIQPNVFCSNDQNPYTPTVSPTGGTITGEGVTTDPSGGQVFSPAAVALNGQKQKTVTLTYTKDQQTATVNVAVYQQPTASFTVTDGSTSTIKVFTNTSIFADRYQWDFGDGSTSVDQNPSHDFVKAGNYVVGLTVSNNTCTNSTTTSVTINPPVTKTCLSPQTIIDNFNNLSNVDAENFDKFRSNYQPYNQLQSFFKDFSTVENQPLATQINFFKTKGAIDLLVNGFTLLFNLFTQLQPRTLILAMYRVLVSLAMYIECIQQDDIDKADVSISPVCQLVADQLNRIQSIFGVLSQPESDQINGLIGDLQAEINRVTTNNEANFKPNYIVALKKCIDLLNAILKAAS
ncbi:MAG TPA: PKD domain-containing protein [Flavipsychrobacter sp.]|nr:PKD domain-containing protein [Flavipsychrobacter sp.]